MVDAADFFPLLCSAVKAAVIIMHGFLLLWKGRIKDLTPGAVRALSSPTNLRGFDVYLDWLFYPIKPPPPNTHTIQKRQLRGGGEKGLDLDPRYARTLMGLSNYRLVLVSYDGCPTVPRLTKPWVRYIPVSFTFCYNKNTHCTCVREIEKRFSFQG